MNGFELKMVACVNAKILLQEIAFSSDYHTTNLFVLTRLLSQVNNAQEARPLAEE